MKKNKIFVLIILLCLFTNYSVLAAEFKDNPTASECFSYASPSFKTIKNKEGESAEYRYCYRVACSTSGTYNVVNAMNSSGYKCSNYNDDPYVIETENGCSKYTGSCVVDYAKYCERKISIDCNRKKDGSTYVKPTNPGAEENPGDTNPGGTDPGNSNPGNTGGNGTTTTKIVTNKKTTTKKTTTKKQNTSSNTNIKKLTVDGNEIKVKNNVNEYDVKIPYGKANVTVKVVLEDSTSTYKVSGNRDMPDTDTDISIEVTSGNGTKRYVTIHVKRYVQKSSDCTIKELNIKDHNLKFKPTKYNYRLKIPKIEKELELDIVFNDNQNAKYKVEGNKSLKNNSKIRINVTAEDGTVCKYVIKIKNPSSAGKIILVLILIGLIALVLTLITKRSVFKAQGKYKYEK